MNPLIETKIYFIRGRKVMLDRDLAQLYGVETRSLNQAVQRNIERFPKDFMFKLTVDEERSLISQTVISNQESSLDKAKSSRSHFVTLKKGGHRKLPYAFTEQGVAMLSSVLRSKQAILVNIQIMRTFTKIREMLASNKDLREKIDELEQKYDQQFTEVFEAINLLLFPPDEPKGKIGFEVRE